MRSVFFDYPEMFVAPGVCGDTLGVVSPSSTYDFRVDKKTRIKHLHWSDNLVMTRPDTAVTKLKELIKLIETIIESHPEYSGLPRPRGGYL